MASLTALGSLAVFALLVAAEAGPPAGRGRLSDDDIQGDAGEAAEPETTLVQVQVLFRHGVRTPTGPPYPTDPYANCTYEPYGLGHLTKLGREVEFSLGLWLRLRYMGRNATEGWLLNPDFETGVVRVNTTAIERTQESAAAFLAALFPPGTSQAWTADGTSLGSMWIPIPYHIIPEDEDLALASSAPCPARDLEMHNVLSDPSYQKQLLRVLGGPSTVQYLAKHAGTSDDITNTTFTAQVANVFSTLQCQEALNMALPEWTEQVYPEPLRSAASMFDTSFSSTPTLRRLGFGGLSTGILYAAREHESLPNMLVYSAHDTTVSAGIDIFQLEPQDDAGFGIPEFGACLLMELHRDSSGTLGLQFFYRRVSEGPVVRMIPKGCSAFCDLDTVERLLREDGTLPTEDDSCSLPDDVPHHVARSLVNGHLRHVKGDVWLGRPSR